MNEEIKVCGEYRYARSVAAGKAAFYFDYYHPVNDPGPEFINARRAMLRFKDRDQAVVARFGDLMADIAQSVKKGKMDAVVVPILGSEDIVTDMAAPTTLAATKIAQAFEIAMLPYCFYQIDKRESLKSGDHSKGPDERRSIVKSVLRCNVAEVRKRKIILVDDILTTGASTEIYAGLISACDGAYHIGTFYAMRTARGKEKQPLNAALYEELDQFNIFGTDDQLF